MSASKKLATTLANAGGGVLNVEDVFSTYLYTGNGSTQTITNGIDLDGEGGLVWIKSRNNSTYANSPNVLTDSVTGFSNYLISSQTTQQQSWNADAPVPSSTGFSLPINSNVPYTNYLTGNTYASWTFRKAPKFFDVVTWTGDGTLNRTIPHNLGVAPGCIITKKTNTTSDWFSYHRSLSSGYIIRLNTTAAQDNFPYRFDPAPSDTSFGVGSLSGAETQLNNNGDTYVAYLFAHNDGDGDFGESGDQDIIKCGSYTSDYPNRVDVNLGFEPQWLLVKSADTTAGWIIVDNMRGIVTGGSDYYLKPNSSGAEAPFSLGGQFELTPTGFTLTGVGFNDVDYPAGTNYIYIAIRRPMKTPESGTEVFAIARGDSTEPNYNSTFPVDAALWNQPAYTGSTFFQSRLTGDKYLLTDSTAAEASLARAKFDFMDGWDSGGLNDTYQSWMFRRAPGFFDVVCYTGNGTAGRTVDHNLGVAPEMMIVKRRNASDWWVVYHSGCSTNNALRLDSNLAEFSFPASFGDNTNIIPPTESVFTIGSNGKVNINSGAFIAYLFTSLPGISKVFSVTKSSGSDASVDCGFSAGPRFVMLKRTDSTGDWYIWDTERGIVAGNDPYLLLNSTAAEVTSTDYIDPTASGFTIVNGGLADGDYIGYAIA
jgi:hypothetical protein